MNDITFALIFLSVVFIACIVIISVQLYRTTQNLHDLTELFLRYVANPGSVDIIESYPIKKKPKSGFTFPNDEGF